METEEGEEVKKSQNGVRETGREKSDRASGKQEAEEGGESQRGAVAPPLPSLASRGRPAASSGTAAVCRHFVGPVRYLDKLIMSKVHQGHGRLSATGIEHERERGRSCRGFPTSGGLASAISPVLDYSHADDLTPPLAVAEPSQSAPPNPRRLAELRSFLGGPSARPRRRERAAAGSRGRRPLDFLRGPHLISLNGGSARA
ncbi:hypothetical protein SKAU_G00017700 [Synaphobranchus kaupii]|uniref:Uncharacterized protein n=1 Tax=Synaphobranchus kaupii TaxID=118154 RepID=A0A9Q1GBJ1_SYNKA|nr:hypothetical protein SKAU_G00017700 [Synaphobranchus kaupii]